MRFLICCYGEHYVPFLAVCLRSLRLSHPAAQVSVIHDFGSSLIEKLKARNPKVDFLYSVEDAASQRHPDQRIAVKIDYWSAALDRAKDGEAIVFLDADTLVRADIFDDLSHDFDVLVTLTGAHPPINTGVVVVRVSDRTRALMRLWRDSTVQIAKDEAAFARAFKIGGGFDQFTLLQLMRVTEGAGPPGGSFRVETPAGPIIFYGASCDVLNQTKSVPLSQGAKILHYKGRWRSILLDGKDFKKTRTFEQSAEMYWLWLDYFHREEKAMGIKTLRWRARLRHLLRRYAYPHSTHAE